MNEDHQTLIALHTTTRARDPFSYSSWYGGVVYDVANNISTILKMTEKRVPGDIDST